MKSLRLLALAMLVCASAVSASHACDASKSAAGVSCLHGATTTATTTATIATAAVASKGAVPSVPADGGCSAEPINFKTAANKTAASSAAKGMNGQCAAEMAAQCTPAMRAACEKNAAVAAAMGCNAKGAAVTTAAMSGGKRDMAHGASKTTMANGASCGTAAATASAAGGAEHCAAMKHSATAAVAGMKCSAHMSAVAQACSACEDWSSCEQDVRSLGAKAQVVSLKNGAMIVYTADRKSDVNALQSVVAKRNDKMVAALSAGSDKKLCDDCKQLRGAMASGKLHREVVNVERGCMTLITSNDRAVVQKIRAMTSQPVAVR